jgi:hypothetical protein
MHRCSMIRDNVARSICLRDDYRGLWPMMVCEGRMRCGMTAMLRERRRPENSLAPVGSKALSPQKSARIDYTKTVFSVTSRNCSQSDVRSAIHCPWS